MIWVTGADRRWEKERLRKEPVLAGRGGVSAGQPRNQWRAWKTSAPSGFYSLPIPGTDFVPLGAL